MHACLREHTDALTPGCRSAEESLQLIQSRDVRLRPVLSRLCSEEIAVLCKGVAPGRARVFRCLADNLGKPGFGEACRAEVDKRVALQQADYRLDTGLAEACAADVDAACGEAKGQVHGHGLVLKCLVARYADLAPACGGEVSRAVRLALWDYSKGGALTGACDADVEAACELEGGGGAVKKGVYSIGAVGRCLAKRAAEEAPLAEACRELVAAAAPKVRWGAWGALAWGGAAASPSPAWAPRRQRQPRISCCYLAASQLPPNHRLLRALCPLCLPQDAESMFPDGLSIDAVAQRVAELATAAGLNGTFVDPSASGTGVITLTGWIAMASIFAVAIVAGAVLVVVVRRVRGLDQPYTLVVKSGDV